MKAPELIIVGGGVGGAAAALRAAQYLLPTVWIRGDKRTHNASRSAWVKNIDNMLGIHPGIMQGRIAALLEAEHPEAAARVREEHFHISTRDLVQNAAERIQAEFSEAVQFVEDRAVSAAREGDAFSVKTGGGEEFIAPHLLLATGVMDRQPVIHKQKGDRDLSGIHWLYPYANQETILYCIRCEGHLTVGKRVAVIGAGPAAAEISLMIRERYGSQVVLLPADEEPHWSEKQAGLLERYEVRVARGPITEVRGADKGATLRGFVLASGEEIQADFGLVAMGLHRVYNDLALSLGADLEPGDLPKGERHVLIDGHGETSVPGLFAVGDMTTRQGEPVMKQVYTAQEYAVRAVDRVDANRRRARRKAGAGA